MIINLDAIGWRWSIFILILSLFLIYLFFGGGEYEYVGLAPLEIGYDAADQRHHYSGEDQITSEEISIDSTPEIPDLDRVKVPEKKPIFLNFSESQQCSSFQPSSMSISNTQSFAEEDSEMKNLENLKDSENWEEYQDPSENSLEVSSASYGPVTNPETPRTAALGPHKCRINSFISKGERLSKQAIEEIYGKPFFCVRPDFLKNPETGRNLELDIYNDELKIAVEYSGKAHYVYPNSFHKSHQEFINQVRRDKFKLERCDANGVYLITVPYNVPLTLEDIKKYITCHLPQNIQNGVNVEHN